MSDREVPPWRCVGWAGRIHGHMFKPWSGSIHTTDFCVRCGMPKGGWSGLAAVEGLPAAYGDESGETS